MKDKEVSISSNGIEKSIYFLRGLKVMLSSDLAVLYGVTPKVLIQAVKRNLERFPDDFMFKLTHQEAGRCSGNSRSQNVTLNRGGNIKYPPYAFTEQGLAMLSSVLRSRRAIQVNVAIMRTFVKLRSVLAEHKDLAKKIEEMERNYDQKFSVVFDALRKLMAEPAEPAPPKRKIGFLSE